MTKLLHIHTCGHHCERPDCIKRDRDTIVQRFGQVVPYRERVEKHMADFEPVNFQVLVSYMREEIEELRACFN